MTTMLSRRARRALPLLLATSLVAGSCAPAAQATDTPVQLDRTGRTTSGMVVSANQIASDVGAEVLRNGGNAVDAAIATGLALAVVHPTAGNIGGGGFMVIRFPDGRTTALDFREKAPLAAHSEMFVDPATGEYSSTIHHRSHLAVGVPGTVAGFDYAHRRYGTAEWSALVQPAVTLAAEGFPLSENLARSFANVLRSMQDYPASVAKFSNDGTPYAEGHVWTQPDLASTLARIRDERSDGFYAGETARLLAAEMERGGGMITLEDLERYEPREMAPVTGTYRGYDIISMPPPSSGGIAMVEMLNILEGFDLRGMGHNTAPYIHHLAEAMRRAYRDRAQHVADPEFADVPVERLTSKWYAAELRSDIDPNRASVSSPEDIMVPAESDQTTHYSVVDGNGLAVSVTYTLEQGYGSKIVVPGAGFLLNNEMGDFNPRPGLTTETGLIGTEPNLARPEQRMISSMTPSILARDGELVAVFGSPGGRTIINTVMQMVLNIVDHQMPIDQAVAAKRIHHQWLPDRIRIEADGTTEQVLEQLRAMGHEVQMGGRQGSVHAIMIDPRTGERIGAADARDADSGSAGF
ncbi:MAG TPA: gamma-glutamyltransferase [Longimicrobiales bacterium]|nr:gamma-glutamyltransferase [Longimicrobiales bacterium]